MNVAIIGAGITGLGAAYTLIKKGFKNVTIFEAQDYIGGRIKSQALGNGYIELGAQWIHGQEDNILFGMASQRELIAPIESYEGVGHFCTQDGQSIDSSLVNQVIMFLDTIKMSISNGDYKLDQENLDGISVADVFRSSFKKWIDGKKCKSPKDSDIIQGIFNWFMKFETIDNSCQSLDQLSVISYSMYRECEGVPLNNFKNGYSSIVHSLLEDIPGESILTNCPVKLVDYSSHSANNQVTLHLANGQTFNAHHVIVTSSIGYLKENMESFFQPKLPSDKAKIIKAMGFGTVNKTYLIFDEPFWKKCDLGFQLIWLKPPSSEKYPSWVQDISGIDTVHGQANVLVAWIGGKGAEMVEQEQDDHVIEIFTSLLKDFIPAAVRTREISKPCKVIRTNWLTNPYIRGAYSNRTTAFEKLKMNLDQLIAPICSRYSLNQEDGQGKEIEWPLVLFAGEATDEKFFSTTHGALQSGFREAERLADFWTKYHLVPASGS